MRVRGGGGHGHYVDFHYGTRAEGACRPPQDCWRGYGFFSERGGRLVGRVEGLRGAPRDSRRHPTRARSAALLASRLSLNWGQSDDKFSLVNFRPSEAMRRRGAKSAEHSSPPRQPSAALRQGTTESKPRSKRPVGHKRRKAWSYLDESSCRQLFHSKRKQRAAIEACWFCRRQDSNWVDHEPIVVGVRVPWPLCPGVSCRAAAHAVA